MLFAAVLAFALAQATPPPESAPPVASPVPAGSALPAAPTASAVPAGPPTPGTQPAPSASASAMAATADDPALAVIVNSGSTNTAGYTLRVRDNGWTTLDVQGAAAPQHKRVAKALAARLFADLRAAGPLAALPRAMCMKSTSFGSVTTLVYHGARSPDLSCPGSSRAASALAADVNALRDAVGVNAMMPRRML